MKRTMRILAISSIVLMLLIACRTTKTAVRRFELPLDPGWLNVKFNVHSDTIWMTKYDSKRLYINIRKYRAYIEKAKKAQEAFNAEEIER